MIKPNYHSSSSGKKKKTGRTDKWDHIELHSFATARLNILQKEESSCRMGEKHSQLFIQNKIHIQN